MIPKTRARQKAENSPADVSRLHLDVSCPRSAGDLAGPRSGLDQITFQRWRLGFFIFYGAAVILLVAGGAVIADRQPASFSAATLTSPAIVTTGSIRAPVDRRMRE